MYGWGPSSEAALVRPIEGVDYDHGTPLRGIGRRRSGISGRTALVDAEVALKLCGAFRSPLRKSRQKSASVINSMPLKQGALLRTTHTIVCAFDASE